MNNYLARLGKKKYHIYHNENGILFKESEGEVYKGEKLLFYSPLPDFDVLVKGDKLYVLCQDANGTVVLLKGDGEGFYKEEVLYSKAKKPFKKNLRLLGTGDTISMLCTLQSEGKTMLVHKIIGDDETPKVLDFVSSCARPFSAENKGDDISLLYADEKQHLKKKIYLKSQNIWHSEGDVLEEHTASNPFVFEDAICFVSKMREFYNVCAVLNGEMHTVYLDCLPSCVPLLARTNGRLSLLFSENSKLYYSSYDKKFSHLAQYTKCQNPKLFGIRGNERNFYTYGEILRQGENMFNIKGVNTPAEISQKESPKEPMQKNRTQSDEILMLKKRIEALEQALIERN